MSEDKQADSSDAVERALKSVEELQNESGGAAAMDDLDPDAIEVLHADDGPISGDPSGEGHAPDPELEEEFANADEFELEAEATGANPALLDDDSDDGDGGDGEEEEIIDEGEEAKPDPQNAMLAAMIQAKNELSSVLEQTQKEAKSMHDRLVRVTADYENYKKRQVREKEDALKFANERLLKELLPVIDNMERAADSARQAGEGSDSEVITGVVEGVEMVHKSFIVTFEKFGVRGFSAHGEQFDPALHEAVAQREDDSVPNNTVVEEYQRGYMLHDRLVRPSMVIVSSGGPPFGSDEASGDEASGDEADDKADHTSNGEDATPADADDAADADADKSGEGEGGE